MRIAIVAGANARLGGVESYLETVAPALRRRGHDVGCWFESGEGPRPPLFGSTAGFPVHVRQADETGWVTSLRRWAPDVLYVHGLRSVSHELQLLDVAPGVFFAHSYHGTCISGMKSHRLPSDACCERRFGPACLAHYFPRRCGGLSPATMVRQYGMQVRRQDLLRRYAAIVVASTHMAGEYARHGFTNTTVVGLPAPPVGRRAAASRSAPWRLAYLGRFEYSKGCDLALRAAEAVSARLRQPVHLQMSGEGTLASELRRQADRAARSSPLLTVTVSGWVDAARRDEMLANAHLLLIPSRWPEPFGLVGLEAAALGVPSIAFASGGIADWLSDRINGRLVAPPPAVDPFAQAICESVSEPAALERMRDGATGVAGRFAMDSHLGRLEPALAAVAIRRNALVAP